MQPTPPTDWRPGAPLETLRFRARLLADVRRFFAERGVLEVETPRLAPCGVSDLHLAGFRTRYRGPGALGDGRELFLQTSPEYAMKRLLAAGSGPIYQLGRAFRDGEAGRLHNPEFTLLEWYRPGFDHHRLMDEMDELLSAVVGSEPAERLTYSELFEEHLGVDPHRAGAAELAAALAEGRTAETADLGRLSRDELLDLAMGDRIEPRLGGGGTRTLRPTFVYDYPASQAALARIRPGDPPVAERFEVYLAGLELANGFHELTDAREQRRRFEADLAARRSRGLPEVPIDERFLAALEAGLPVSAGVALGIDRLVMAALGEGSIDAVLPFSFDRA